VPLVITGCPGAEMRQSLAPAVFAGRLGVTLFGLALTPVFQAAVQRLLRAPPIRRHGRARRVR